MKFIITAHPDKKKAGEAKNKIIKWLNERGHKVVSENQKADLAIGLGGDGFTAHHVAMFSPRGIPSLVINAGDIGFLTVGNVSDWESILERIVAKKFKMEKRVGLELDYRGKKYGPIANDVYLRHSKSVTLLKVTLNKNILYKELVADGFIISTPTGSTGYNASNGGPIVQPGVRCLLMTPISSMGLNTRPIVVTPDSVIELEVLRSKSSGNVSVIADGNDLGILKPGEKITVKKHQTKLLFAFFDHHDFYRALQEKKGLMQ